MLTHPVLTTAPPTLVFVAHETELFRVSATTEHSREEDRMTKAKVATALKTLQQHGEPISQRQVLKTPGSARQGRDQGQGMARRGRGQGQGVARHGMARLGVARRGRAWLG